MTYARKNLVSLADTPYYHVVSRCVRRAWLWGFDRYASRDYSHRKDWVTERLSQLTSVFSIDICAYAVMANHYHLVLHVDRSKANALSPEEVVKRWGRLFRVPLIVARWLQQEGSEAEQALARKIVESWRRRLVDISWFMRTLNEHLARRANAEDGCKGRFWEGRFRSQALVDAAGLLTAMAYVDLNPIRAGIADTPETSAFTSIYERILARATSVEQLDPEVSEPTVPLLPFQGAGSETGIPFSEPEYLQLVDWTGRALRPDKRGAIDAGLPPILHRLNVHGTAWCVVMRPKGNLFGRAIGTLDQLRSHAQTLRQSWIRGLRLAEWLYRIG